MLSGNPRLKIQCSPNGVVSQIEAYEKTNNPNNFERVTGNKVKTPQPKKKPVFSMAKVAKTIKPLPVNFRSMLDDVTITKDMIGLSGTEFLALVNQQMNQK